MTPEQIAARFDALDTRWVELLTAADRGADASQEQAVRGLQWDVAELRLHVRAGDEIWRQRLGEYLAHWAVKLSVRIVLERDLFSGTGRRWPLLAARQRRRRRARLDLEALTEREHWMLEIGSAVVTAELRDRLAQLPVDAPETEPGGAPDPGAQPTDAA